MTIDFDQLRDDMKDGTPGPWAQDNVTPRRINNKSGFSVAAAHLCAIAWDASAAIANARRIARVPDLERIALAAEKYRRADETVRTASDWMIASVAAMDRVEARHELFALLTKVEGAE